MIEKGFIACAGGRYFRAKENSGALPPAMLLSATLDLLFRECEIIGVESINEPYNEGMIFVLRQNFGRYLVVIIEVDMDAEEHDLTLVIDIAEAEEITAEEADI